MSNFQILILLFVFLTFIFNLSIFSLFFSFRFTILGNIERPIINSFPNGVYLKFEISSDSFLTFSYGADQSSMQVLASHVPFSSPWPLSNMNLFRVVSVSADYEPGAKFSDISLSYQFIPDAPICLILFFEKKKKSFFLLNIKY